MIDLPKLIVVLPSLLPFTYEAKVPNDFYSYPVCIVRQSELTDIMPQRVYTNADLIEDNTDQIIQQLYKVSTEDEQ